MWKPSRGKVVGGGGWSGMEIPCPESNPGSYGIDLGLPDGIWQFEEFLGSLKCVGILWGKPG